MWRALLVCVTTLSVHCEAQTGSDICRHHSTFRQAADWDITVTCGTDSIHLSILLCPVYYAGYNESLIALNGKFNMPACRGIVDLIASTPVLKFNFSVSDEEVSLCDNSLELTDEVGTGQFSDSRVQFVNISGSIISWEPVRDPFTYHQKLIYRFSCLQYLVNDTKVNVSGMNLAARGNRGSFVRALHINFFTNRQYTQPLKIPEKGLQLKTRIYVQVKATNLTNRLNILLDRCFTTTSPYPISTIYYDLFVGCRHDGQTVVYLNGVSQEARFSFEAFQFVEHQNKTIFSTFSTFYLHCVTRLCENSTCPSMLPNCIKNVRSTLQLNQYLSNVETVSSGPIKTRTDSDCVTGVIILTCLLSVCCTGLVVWILIYRRRT
ncbi:zona pellucida-like domain-containing protein 1 [Ictalurus punctatus]|uniref:Zona pellucida-like domain-containing protein 1 n=1 Tax=Ictalurus punctatus TaxID=7998 RepID=A0A2D0SVE0_ICTPU|nr:zona pellucida-like domain-containing protein 1 [Ictalurus punctatus]XP_053543537.1 zona pellucida-like domain-containing protein 1 [Ictalurus punctatus]